MLLSVDRVLQLLSEGKTTSKIADMAHCSESDVVDVIKEARDIIKRHEKHLSKRKIIIKKNGARERKVEQGDDPDSINIAEILKGSELSAIPVESKLIMYVRGLSNGNPGHSGIGIIIYDKENRQIGKVSLYIGNSTEIDAEYSAILKAMKIAEYFNTKALYIRTDSRSVLDQLNINSNEPDSGKTERIHNEIIKLKDTIGNCKFEYVSKNSNDKAYHQAEISLLPKR